MEKEYKLIVIGLTGSFGSGCSNIIAKKFLIPKEFQYFSLSTALKEMYREEKGKDSSNRTELQDFGNVLRERYGNDYLARKTCDELEKKNGNRFVIDSIRNPGEVKYLREKFLKFFLFGIYADEEVRWERVKEDYHRVNRDRREFDEDDKRDAGESFDHGQRVRACYLMSDIIISNNDNIRNNNKPEQLMDQRINDYISMIEKKKEFSPSEKETIMAMAYANSYRSSCLKRKVGAIIIDGEGNVFSSGYNEVPKDDDTCAQKWGQCYRSYLREKILKKLENIFNDRQKRDEMNIILKEEFKILDHCRALHAEENAILNVARFGSSAALKDATLYTTTYPCNMCANKIVKVGIKKIVYLEPYPQKEAIEIISGKVMQEPFEGVLFNGYFRIYGGKI